jgi:excisionase family DNA binding protein
VEQLQQELAKSHPDGNGHGGVNGGLLTADQVAGLLGVPKSWVYEQSRAGRIPTVTLGRYRRYRREAIELWLEQLEADGANGGRKHPAA